MLVREVMSAPAVTVQVETLVKTALIALDTHSITMLPVVTADGRIVGVVSEADLIRDSVPADPRHHLLDVTRELRVLPPRTVGELMNPHPVTVPVDADLADAVELMTSTVVKSLPVVDDHDRVVGVVSRRDVVRLLARPDRVIEAEVDDLFRRLDLEWLVDVRDGVVTVTGPQGRKQRALAAAVVSTVRGAVGLLIAREVRA